MNGRTIKIILSILIYFVMDCKTYNDVFLLIISTKV